MKPIERLLDANANRAREAMRVMEDAARFLLDDASLSADLKRLRHDFAAAMSRLPNIEQTRNTPGDVGTTVSTPAEGDRRSVRDVAVAAGKRLSEALRSLEEYGKLVDPGWAAAIEKLRYRGYDLEQRLVAAIGPLHRRQWRLCVILTEELCTEHVAFDVAKDALEAGADCLQLREKSMEAGELLARAQGLAELVETHAACLIVNDRPDVASICGAHGVHLGQTDLPAAHVRRRFPQLIVGVSTHSLAEAKAADAAHVDYCGVGAIYATTTKQRKPSGLAYLTKFVERYPDMPHLAIGGITPDNIAEVVDAGARGVAVSSVVCGAKKPGAVVKKLLGAIGT
ncbi:MAG: thiamine phosphate synthase [Phycisphaera sp.]|nr:thiamine phosphate synthase [Phycisphaera sp.]